MSLFLKKELILIFLCGFGGQCKKNRLNVHCDFSVGFGIEIANVLTKNERL